MTGRGAEEKKFLTMIFKIPADKNPEYFHHPFNKS